MSNRDKLVKALNEAIENLDNDSLVELCREWVPCEVCPLNSTAQCTYSCNTNMLKYLMEDNA